MTEPDNLRIRIVKGDTVFHVHGDQAGSEGVWLAKGQVDGIYDNPVKTTDKSGAFQVGSKRKHHKWLQRDLILGFHIIDTVMDNYAWNDSEFRKIFDYDSDPYDEDEPPTTIEVETDMSGVRKIDVLMFEQPDFGPDIDPNKNQHGNIIMKLRANQPFWYEDGQDTVTGFHEDSFSALTASGSGSVTVENPTDQDMLQKWILTPATWTLPDYSWVGAKGSRVPGGAHMTRTVAGPVTVGNGGATIDLDGTELMIRDANDTNVLAQWAGKFFNHVIPAYTPATDLPVSYSGAPGGGAMVRLVMPRQWSRPWGLER